MYTMYLSVVPYFYIFNVYSLIDISIITVFLPELQNCTLNSNSKSGLPFLETSISNFKKRRDIVKTLKKIAVRNKTTE